MTKDVQGIDKEELIELASETAYEVNRAYDGDQSLLDWKDAPEWQRVTVRIGMRQIFDGEIMDPYQSHVAWWQHKLEEGWKYGPVKDVEKKEHPCMVPYNQLPANQQIKDHLFFGVATAMMRHVL